MYRIRLHGRGGQGIKTAGQILGNAFFLCGFQVQDAPRYGAERRGAPVAFTVRASHEPINERGPMGSPDLIVVADPSLFQVPSAGVLQGASTASVLLIVSPDPPTLWSERLAFPGPVLTASPAGDPAHPAIALVGAATRMTGVISESGLESAIRAELSPLGEERTGRELDRALRMYADFACHSGMVREQAETAICDEPKPQWVDLSLDAVALAAPDIHAPANSVLSKTGFWRVQRPVIDAGRCHRCSWICSTLCPDSAITVAADRTPVIDIDHCKGCMVCVTVCPAHAIDVVPERQAAAGDAQGIAR